WKSTSHFSDDLPIRQIDLSNNCLGHIHTRTHLTSRRTSSPTSNLDRFGGVAVAAKADASIADLLNELGALNAQAGAKQTRSTVEDSAIPSQSRFWNRETKSMAILGA
ncbi:hypothetical protein Drorol1_Dr00004687, partial [Drosera rotundifolia]